MTDALSSEILKKKLEGVRASPSGSAAIVWRAL
jgi:hypothetical protein